MEDNIRKTVSQNTESPNDGTAAQPLDELVDLSVPLKDKLIAAEVPTVTSHALITDVFECLAESSALEVYRHSITNKNGSLNFPAAFIHWDIDSSQASLLSFSELMLMIQDYVEGSIKQCRYSCHEVIIAVALIAKRFYYSAEDILNGNRPVLHEDSKIAFALRQFLYADPQAYLMWLKEKTNAPEEIRRINNVLAYVTDYPEECIDHALNDDAKTPVMALGAMLFNFYEMLNYLTTTPKEESKMIDFINTLLVTPFAAYAKHKGTTPDMIRDNLIEFSEHGM